VGRQAILVSPEVVFRLGREPADTRPGEGYPLSDIDLATRLSFFLWATVPDEELLEVAGSGRLSEPEVLEAQVERMLRDAVARSMPSATPAMTLSVRVFMRSGRFSVMNATVSTSSYSTTGSGSLVPPAPPAGPTSPMSDFMARTLAAQAQAHGC